jgi:hypothetical protein
MSATSHTRPRNVLRRAERWAVGLVMALVAVVLERAVMRAVRKEGRSEAPPAPTTLTSKGGEVDLDEGLSGPG